MSAKEEEIKKRLVSVLSYNVNWGYGLQRSQKSFFVDPETKRKRGKTLTSKPVKRVIRCIVEANADVVCLQETHEGWEELLMRNKEIKKVYKYKWFNHPHEKFGGSGTKNFVKKSTRTSTQKNKTIHRCGVYLQISHIENTSTQMRERWIHGTGFDVYSSL